MALSGIHIACGMIGVQNGVALLLNPAWSQTISGSGTTTLSASDQTRVVGNTGFSNLQLGFEINAAADYWVAWGPNPDASQVSGSGNSGRVLVRSGTDRNVFCRAGDKVNAVVA